MIGGYAAIVNDMEAIWHSMKEEKTSHANIMNYAHELSAVRSKLALEYCVKRKKGIRKVKNLLNGLENMWKPEDDGCEQILPFLNGLSLRS